VQRERLIAPAHPKSFVVSREISTVLIDHRFLFHPDLFLYPLASAFAFFRDWQTKLV
jgi:hypothetical protein